MPDVVLCLVASAESILHFHFLHGGIVQGVEPEFEVQGGVWQI